jgi:hypothetical protein
MSLGYCSECGESYGHRDYCARNKPTYEELEQQLGEREKQIVMLRGFVKLLRDYIPASAIGNMTVQEALAATQGLSGLVLCDAEPVAWMRKWASDKEVPAKVKGDNGRWYWPRQFKILPLTEAKWFADDVPIYKELWK